MIVFDSVFIQEIFFVLNQAFAIFYPIFEDPKAIFIYSSLQAVLYAYSWKVTGFRASLIFLAITDILMAVGLLSFPLGFPWFTETFKVVGGLSLFCQIGFYVVSPVRSIPNYFFKYSVGYKEINLHGNLLAVYYPTDEQYDSKRDELWVKEEGYFFTMLRVFRYYSMKSFPSSLFYLFIDYLRKITLGVIVDAKVAKGAGKKTLSPSAFKKESEWFRNAQFHLKNGGKGKSYDENLRHLREIIKAAGLDSKEGNHQSQILEPIIFSHGFGATRNVYSYLTKAFASTGKYIIFSLEHNDELWNRSFFPNHVFFGIMFKYLRVKRLPQMHQVVDFIYSHSSFLNPRDKVEPLFPDSQVVIDLFKLSIMGHSYGGATAILSCAHDYRINGDCLTYDPWLTPLENFRLGEDGKKISGTKLLVTMSERFPINNPDYELHEKVRSLLVRKDEALGRTYVRTLLAAGHNSCSDVVFPLELVSKMIKMIGKRATKDVAKTLMRMWMKFLEFEQMESQEEFTSKFEEELQKTNDLKHLTSFLK